MSEARLTRIRELDNFQVVRFYQYFAQKLFNDIDIDLNKLRSQIPEQIRETPEIASVLSITDPVKAEFLSFDNAVVCARKTLTAFAIHPGWREVLSQVLEEDWDDELAPNVAVNCGLAALMLIIATTDFQLNYVSPDGRLKADIRKHPATTEMVEVVKELAMPAAIISSTAVLSASKKLPL